MMKSWTDVLDVLERQLNRQERAFRIAGDLPNVLVLERPDEPMSATEEVRAIDLMQRHDALITDTLEMMKRGRTQTASPYS